MVTSSIEARRNRALGRRRRVVLVAAWRICRVVAETYGVEAAALRGPRRTQELAEARQVAMYLMRTDLYWPCADGSLGPMPYRDIAVVVRRDWSTVRHGCQAMERRAAKDHEVQGILCDLRALLGAQTPPDTCLGSSHLRHSNRAEAEGHSR